MSDTIDTHELAALIKALGCISGELTPDELRQFEECILLDNPELRRASFERLMLDLLCRIKVRDITLH